MGVGGVSTHNVEELKGHLNVSEHQTESSPCVVEKQHNIFTQAAVERQQTHSKTSVNIPAGRQNESLLEQNTPDTSVFLIH